MADTISIDGSQGEGGGQILRTSLALAAVTGQAVRLSNIRRGRPKPGLAAQHLTSCRAVAAACGGELAGDRLGSQAIELHPRKRAGGEYLFDVSAESASAGSTGLVFQALLPPLLFAGQASHLILRGGTDVPWSPVYYYLTEVFAPIVRMMGAQFTLMRKRAGWYPAGGGEIEAEIQPLTAKLQPMTMTARGELRSLTCHSLSSDRLPWHIVTRQGQGARQALGLEGRSLVCETEQLPSSSPGTTCLAVARFERGAGGFTALGKRGKPAEEVGAEAGLALRDFLRGRATVDEHLADQLLLYAALAEGTSVYLAPQATEHLHTNALVLRQLVGVETQIVDSPEGARVSLTGLGLKPDEG